MNGRIPLYQANKTKQKEGGDNVISIGIDVAKNKCVATLKRDSRDILKQITFYNNTNE